MQLGKEGPHQLSTTGQSRIASLRRADNSVFPGFHNLRRQKWLSTSFTLKSAVGC